jgi:hypothetical protein
MERQAPLAGKRGHLAARNLADMLDRDNLVRRLRKKSLVVGIDDDADRKPIHDGRGKGHGGTRIRAHPDHQRSVRMASKKREC